MLTHAPSETFALQKIHAKDRLSFRDELARYAKRVSFSACAFADCPRRAVNCRVWSSNPNWGLEMPEIEGAAELNLMELAADIVAAFVSHNSLPVAELPGLIASVDAALRGLVSRAPTAAETEKPTPAVPIKKSITPDYLICLGGEALGPGEEHGAWTGAQDGGG